MENEKIKEIKKALEDNKTDHLPYIYGWECKFVEYADILTLINELESENERLMKLQARGGCRVAELGIKNQQLKDRIAELEKENARLANRINYQVVLPDDKLEEIKKECLEKIELAKGELLKQFAERLKEKKPCFTTNPVGVDTEHGWDMCIKTIDETLKEFIGENEND